MAEELDDPQPRVLPDQVSGSSAIGFDLPSCGEPCVTRG